jgi:diguanylate cyclase (GGDEF)-like protein
VRALRDRTLAEQESIRRAELDAHRIMSEQLRHQATHDPLTGLPNRAAAFGRLAAAIRAADDRRIGLCYLDLDGFKGINDRYGHDAGDELLVRVAERIGRVASAYGALAARIGGDEFVVVAECSPGITGMIALAMDILAEVSHPVALRIGRVSVSACAGIVDRAAGSPATETMVADADAALYQAKSHGPGHWAAHDPARQQAS